MANVDPKRARVHLSLSDIASDEDEAQLYRDLGVENAPRWVQRMALAEALDDREREDFNGRG